MVLLMTDDDGLHRFNDIDSLLIDIDKRYRLRLEFCQPKPRMVFVVTNGEGWHRFGDTRGEWEGQLDGALGNLKMHRGTRLRRRNPKPVAPLLMSCSEVFRGGVRLPAPASLEAS